MTNMLVLAPHADDEILGCGGTIAHHVKSRDNVYVAIMTNAHIGAPELFSKENIDSIRNEALRAHARLGVKKTFFFDFPAPQLEQFPMYRIAQKIADLILKLKVDDLYIPHKGDLHLDHGVIYNAALVAARPFPDAKVRSIYSYETLSETEWGYPSQEKAFIPNRFVEISGELLEAKISAMECYESQLKIYPNTRSIGGIKMLANSRGSTVGVDSAEAFMVIREVLKND